MVCQRLRQRQSTYKNFLVIKVAVYNDRTGLVLLFSARVLAFVSQHIAAPDA